MTGNGQYISVKGADVCKRGHAPLPTGPGWAISTEDLCSHDDGEIAQSGPRSDCRPGPLRLPRRCDAADIALE